MATGNTARVYKLPVGVIEPGREADMCIVDAPIGSVGKTALEALRAGDLFGISMVLIDGQIKIGRSRKHASRGSRGGGGQGTRTRWRRPLGPSPWPFPEGRGDRSLPLLFEG